MDNNLKEFRERIKKGKIHFSSEMPKFIVPKKEEDRTHTIQNDGFTYFTKKTEIK